MLWKIYAGVDRADFAEVEHFATKAEAETYAFDLACDQYECLAGIEGIRSVEDIREEELVDWNAAHATYENERAKRIEYRVEPI